MEGARRRAITCSWGCCGEGEASDGVVGRGRREIVAMVGDGS